VRRFNALVLAGVLCAPAAALAQDSGLSKLDQALAAAADRAAASVVMIEVERSTYGPRPLTTLERRGLGITGPYDRRYFARPEGPCSGVVIAPGLVATSSWNLEGDGEVTVTDTAGKKHSARRAGRDDNLRVALLKVDAPLKPLQPATSDLRPGRFLLRVGRPKANRPLVTRGIVSGMGRLRGDAFTHSCRTSFANVGGALVDLEGKLVGVAVRHDNRARQGQSSGVGFGARLDRVQPNLESLAAGTIIPMRPTAFLGIGPNPTYAGSGTQIGRIVKDTAAEKVGLKPGDVIKIFNSVELQGFGQLAEEIQKLEVGAEIIITVIRDGKEIDFKVKLGKRPPLPR
jgi:S1-C subfamily serine protease